MTRSCLILSILVVSAVHAGAAAPPIPFPRALDGAAIEVPTLDSVLDHSLIVGNGDINGLLHTDGDTVVLRLSKNDVWDARLDTSQDPPLLPMARIRELAKGDWPQGGSFGGGWLGPDGKPHRGGNSWQKPYPCPRPCGMVRLGSGVGGASWRCIRAQGSHNAWERKGTAAVMSIQGKAEASNGYALGLPPLSTSDYTTIRVKLSGTENARYFIDLIAEGGAVVFGSKWIETPTTSEERVFALPKGKHATRIILYTWTEDGKRAENRFESLALEGPKGTLPIDLTLPTPPQRPGRLDLRRAVASAEGTVVRALAQGNVFLIRSDKPAHLAPPGAGAVPAATSGERDGVAWMAQNMPADLDWPGMSYAVALAQKGDRKAVAMVTSHESKDPVRDACALARTTLAEDAQKLIAEHEAAWDRFWSASGVDLGDGLLGRAWYQNLYFLRCVSKPGVQAVGLYAGLVSDGLPAWHGGHTTNYNAEQTFWSSFPTNHVELNEPYERLVGDYLPRARWLCRQLFDCDGAYYPHNLFNFEPSDPETCKSRIGRQQFYVSWSYTIGVSGFTVQNLWLRYKYQPDRAYLDKVAYPAVRDVAVFYANYIGQCEDGGDGKVVLAPSVSPEHWGWTRNFERNRNCTFDIAFARYTMRAAIEGATVLGRDDALVARFRKALARLPAYPTTKGDAPVVVDVEGAPPITYNIAVPVTPVFPGDVVTWFSPADEKKLFARTIAGCRWNGNNSIYILSVARARLSLPGSADWLEAEIKARLRPNQTITLNRLGNHFNSNGHYTEQFAASMAVSELLLQSVGDIVRVFPAWPRERDARFATLRAQGGFLVSAEQKAGAVAPIAVTSTVGGVLRLLSPWPGIRVRRGAKTTPLEPDARGVIAVETQTGERLQFLPKE